MLEITGINLIAKNPSIDVLAELEIFIKYRSEIKVFWAEAGKCQHTEAQIDWADELSELISVCNNLTETNHSKINLAVFQTFIGETIEFPITLKAST